MTTAFDEAGNLRDFDQIYAAEPDPWEQSGDGDRLGAYYAHSRARLLDAIEWHVQPGPCLEVGCGHGHLTRLLAERFGPTQAWTGLDVSRRAVAMARQDGGHFVAGDICGYLSFEPGSFSCVLLAQCWWYVMERHRRLVSACLSLLAPKGVLVISQGFLPETEQQYGREIAIGFEGCLALFLQHHGNRLRLLHARADVDYLCGLRDGLMVFGRR